MNPCYFEDANVGYTTFAYEHLITEEEIIQFAEQWDPMPFHTDPKLAESSPYGGLTASGAHIYAIFVKLAHKQKRKMAVIAALGVSELAFKLPVRPNDTLYMKGVCTETRASASKNDRGICTFAFTLINQHAQIVLTLTQPLLLAKKDKGLDLFSTS